MKRFIPGFILVFLLCAAILPLQSAEKTQTFTRTFPFKNGGKLILKAGDGHVFVTGGKTQELSLKITKRVYAASQAKARTILNAITIDIRQQFDRIQIEENSPNRNFSLFDIFSPDFWKNRSLRIEVDYILTVPPKTRLNLKTDDGDITIRNVAGEIQAKTDDGTIKIRNCSSGTLSLSSDDGNMRISQIQSGKKSLSRLFFESDDGQIVIKHSRFEKISGETDDGDVYIVNTAVHTLDISTNQGDVEAVVSSQKEPVWRIQTDEGDMLLVIPESLSAKLNMFTNEGTISSDFDFPIKKQDDGMACQTELNGGNGNISLHTQEGDIQIEKE
ncbi:MAG: DUF4097 domain-containing protein [Calditrichaeota bacterium]|nr:DUF4097 domain-containing protein [Calditrichota bacterium]